MKSTSFCDNFLKFTVIFLQHFFVRLLPLRNTLDNNLLGVSNKERLSNE